MIDVEGIWEVIIAVLLASAGGLARLLSPNAGRRLKLSRIASELFVSGFSGLMILMLARAAGFSGDILGVAAGVSGWIGPKVLDHIAKTLSKVLRIDIDKAYDDKNT
jgi:hypothetical protein